MGAVNRFVYVAIAPGSPLSDGNSIASYGVAENGALTAVPGSPFPTAGPGSGGGNLAVDPLGRFVYMTNISSDAIANISALRIAENGSLTAVPGSPFQTAGAGGLAVDPSGRFIYEANAGVSTYRIAENGSLIPVPGSPFLTQGVFPSAVAVGHRFVYATNASSNNISGFRIAENGSLIPVPGSPFLTAGTGSGSVAVDPVGRFVYVANASTNNIAGFRIAENGALTQVPGSPFPTGTNLNYDWLSSIAVDLFGRFLYVANYFSGNISAYRIAENGALTPVVGSPFSRQYRTVIVAVGPEF